jgi:hypothetical protein
MLAIDLWEIRLAVKDAIEADAECYQIKVEVEREMVIGPGDTPVAIVYLEERSAPSEDQALGLGRVDFQLLFNVLVGCFSMAGPDVAAKRRDEAIGAVEGALMASGKLGGGVTSLRLLGGRMLQSRDTAGFMAWGEVRFSCRAWATAP